MAENGMKSEYFTYLSVLVWEDIELRSRTSFHVSDRGHLTTLIYHDAIQVQYKRLQHVHMVHV